MIQVQREAAKRQQQWFEEQVATKQHMSKEIQNGLQREMTQMMELHDKESNLWQVIKERYEM